MLKNTAQKVYNHQLFHAPMSSFILGYDRLFPLLINLQRKNILKK